MEGTLPGPASHSDLIVWSWAAVDPLYRDDWLLENYLVFAFVPVLVWSWFRRRASASAIRHNSAKCLRYEAATVALSMSIALYGSSHMKMAVLSPYTMNLPGLKPGVSCELLLGSARAV